MDTGSSIIYIPKTDFDNLFRKINDKNQNKCEESGGLIYCYKCPETGGVYEPITITLNVKMNIRVLPKFYLEYDKEYDRCLLLIKGINGVLDHWVLGDSFLRPLYQVYDAENYRVGLMTNELTLGPDHEDLIFFD